VPGPEVTLQPDDDIVMTSIRRRLRNAVLRGL